MFERFHHCGPRDHRDCGPRGRRGPGWGATFGFGPWTGHAGPWGGGGGGGGGRSRMFGQGDLKFVVLNLLAEKPRHGYEIIKELEDRFGGAYSPSPGTVYPTLSLLEDMGYARATLEEGNRKVFEITDEGRKYLEDNRTVVDDIFGRVDEIGSFVFGPTMSGLAGGFGNLGKAAFRGAMRHQEDEEWSKRVAEILERARKDIEELG
jgi:DNA-binding PadR family transcriptional regulator